MKLTIKNKLFLTLVALGITTSASAQLVDTAGDVLTSIFGSPVGTVTDGINDGARTVTGTTTVKGEVNTTVEAGDITQSIHGGENNINELNMGSVSGGAFVDGKFTSKVTVGSVTQEIEGENNFNRANIGSVTN